MPVYRIVAAVAAVAVLLAVIGLAWAIDGSGTGSTPGAATRSRTGDVAATAAPGHGAGHGSGNGSPRAGAGSASGGRTGAGTTNGGSASSTDVEQPSAQGDAGYRLPVHKARQSGPLLGATLPRGGSGGAGLVKGFPTAVVPLVPRSRVSTNSVSPSGGRLQVSLVATRDRGPDAVLRFYRARLGGLGFSEKPTHAVGGSTAVAFERGSSSVVVTVTPAQRLTYSVFAILAGAS